MSPEHGSSTRRIFPVQCAALGGRSLSAGVVHRRLPVVAPNKPGSGSRASLGSSRSPSPRHRVPEAVRERQVPRRDRAARKAHGEELEAQAAVREHSRAVGHSAARLRTRRPSTASACVAVVLLVRAEPHAHEHRVLGRRDQAWSRMVHQETNWYRLAVRNP